MLRIIIEAWCYCRIHRELESYSIVHPSIASYSILDQASVQKEAPDAELNESLAAFVFCALSIASNLPKVDQATFPEMRNYNLKLPGAANRLWLTSHCSHRRLFIGLNFIQRIVAIAQDSSWRVTTVQSSMPNRALETQARKPPTTYSEQIIRQYSLNRLTQYHTEIWASS